MPFTARPMPDDVLRDLVQAARSGMTEAQALTLICTNDPMVARDYATIRRTVSMVDGDVRELVEAVQTINGWLKGRGAAKHPVNITTIPADVRDLRAALSKITAQNIGGGDA